MALSVVRPTASALAWDILTVPITVRWRVGGGVAMREGKARRSIVRCGMACVRSTACGNGLEANA